MKREVGSSRHEVRELPEHIADRRARLARQQRGCVLTRSSALQQCASPDALLAELQTNNAAQLDNDLTEFSVNWSALEEARRNAREARIANVVLWVALLALLALIGAAAIAAGSGALD